VLTKSFEHDGNGNVKALNYVLVRWDKDDNGRWQMSEVEGSEGQIKADLVLLAMGFVHPVHEGMLAELTEAKGLELDPRGNVKGSTEGQQPTAPASKACSPPATCAAANRWWSGPSAKAAVRAGGR
jgi:NADPH-dependent glutamate synthase beta subunit-like oxidoreductase